MFRSLELHIRILVGISSMSPLMVQEQGYFFFGSKKTEVLLAKNTNQLYRIPFIVLMIKPLWNDNFIIYDFTFLEEKNYFYIPLSKIGYFLCLHKIFVNSSSFGGDKICSAKATKLG